MSRTSSSHRFLCDEVKQMKTEIQEIRDELKQLNNKINQLTDEVKPLMAESIHHPGYISTFRNIFGQSYLNRFGGMANKNLCSVVKFLWILLLTVSLILMTYQIAEITKDYANEIIITQISHIETNFTEINRPSICFTIFPDFLYKRAVNGTFDTLEPLDNNSLLNLGYIKAMVPHFASSGLWLSRTPRENITWSQFQSLDARSWPSMTPENASLQSQTTLYDSLYYWGIGQIISEDNSEALSLWPSHIYSKLSYGSKFFSDILAKFKSLHVSQYYTDKSWICVPIGFSTTNYVSPSGKGLQWFQYGHYYGEPARRNVLDEMVFSTMYFNTKHYPLDDYYAQSFLNSDVAYKYDIVSYILMPTKFQHANLSRQKCYDAKGEIYPRGYGETVCFRDCMWENHARLFNCSFWEDFNEHPSMQVCHIFDIFDQVRSHMSETCLSDGDQGWCNNETSKPVDEWNGLILQTYRDKVINEAYLSGCKQKCDGWMFCDEWEFEYGLRYQYSLEKQNESGLNWSGSEMHREYTVSTYISVNKEILRESFEEFIANLGGTMGFYFDFSIYNCLQLLLFFSISCWGKILELCKKEQIQVIHDIDHGTETPNNMRNIGMVVMDQPE